MKSTWRQSVFMQANGVKVKLGNVQGVFLFFGEVVSAKVNRKE